jgi:hypothetical protein
VNGKSEIPTGEVNGQLSKEVITSTDLSGPLIGKAVTDLTNLMKNDSIYVVIRTQAHENGKIQESKPLQTLAMCRHLLFLADEALT